MRKPYKVFRIYRDVRFSNDKTPYKTSMSAVIAADARGEDMPCYYLNIAPGGESFVGGGIHMPESDTLKSIRNYIDKNPTDFQKLEKSTAFSRRFPDGLSCERSLKNAPRGYETEHEAIEYLNLKSFIAGKNITNTDINSSGITKQLIADFRALHKLNSILYEI